MLDKSEYSPVVLAAILAYVGLQLALGFWVSRRVATEEDYLVAGRRLGYGMTALSVFATWFGAETCIGSASEAYGHGLSGTTADPFGYALCILLMGTVFASALWKRGLTTFADLFRLRFGKGAERLAVVIIAPTSLMWAAAQIRAFGQVLGASSELTTSAAIAVAALVVIVYTAVGGMLADVITDSVQGVVLVSGLILIGTMAWLSGDLGGLQEVEASRRSLFAPGASAMDLAEAWAVPILGSVMAPELVGRVLAAKSPQVARRATIAAAFLYFTVGLVPVAMGLLATRALPGLDDPEQVLLHQAARYLPGLLYAIFAGALVSAILSTVDSALLVAGSLVAHNVVLPALGEVEPARALRINRLAVTCSGALAYLLARSADSVYALVEEASAFGSAGIVVCACFALFSRIGGRGSALASLSSGVLVYAAGAYWLELRHPYLVSLVCALTSYLVVAVREQPTVVDARA